MTETPLLATVTLRGVPFGPGDEVPVMRRALSSETPGRAVGRAVEVRERS